MCSFLSSFSFSFFFFFCKFSVHFNNSHENFISRDQRDGPDAVCVDSGTHDRG